MRNEAVSVSYCLYAFIKYKDNKILFSGVYTCMDPHQPIPNLVVKRVRGDNTCGEGRWEDNLMPGNLKTKSTTYPALDGEYLSFLPLNF